MDTKKFIKQEDSPAEPSGAGGGAPVSGTTSRSSSTLRRKVSSIKKEETTSDFASEKNEKVDVKNVDMELFLQSIEKPCQIYRFLRTRNMLLPIFLQRNLSYMQSRYSRSHQSRRNFKIDSMLEEKMKRLRQEKASTVATVASEKLKIMFLGLFDDRPHPQLNGSSNGYDSCDSLVDHDLNPSEPFPVRNSGRRSVVLEANLIKISPHKRNGCSSPNVMQVSLGMFRVPINNSRADSDDSDEGVDDDVDIINDGKRPTLTIPTEMFNDAFNETTAQRTTFVLLFRASHTTRASDETALRNGYCTDSEEPSAKRQKLHVDTTMYATELTVFDKYGQCQLLDAEYELTMHDVLTPAEETRWVDAAPSSLGEEVEFTPMEDYSNTSRNDAEREANNMTLFEDFIAPPRLKLKVQWTKKPLLEPPENTNPEAGNEMVMGDSNGGDAVNGSSDKENCKPPEPMTPPSNTAAASFKRGLNININNNSILTPAAATGHHDEVEPLKKRGNQGSGEDSSAPVGYRALGGSSDLATSRWKQSDIDASSSNVKYVVYQFTHTNFTRQRTEHTLVFRCPWCSVNCGALYPLLKHLKLVHARFGFNYVPIPDGAQIDVTINEQFDGSYNGSPHDLFFPATAFTHRCAPERRTVVTNLLVCRPRRQKPSLMEFVECDENEFDSQRPFITGHNRMYHHTMTCLPVHPRELDNDSESESDPLWLQHKTKQMIDEFTDVNEGEKEIMKMWNLHVMKYGYVGDCQIPIALDMFVEMRGREIWSRNLYRNFVLHMCSMSDFNLVSPEVQLRIIRKLRKILSSDPELQNIVAKCRAEHVTCWNEVTQFKPEVQMPKAWVANGEPNTSSSGGPSTNSMLGNNTTNPGEGQQRKVKPTIMPAKNTDTRADSPPRRRSAKAAKAANAVKAAKAARAARVVKASKEVKAIGKRFASSIQKKSKKSNKGSKCCRGPATVATTTTAITANANAKQKLASSTSSSVVAATSSSTSLSIIPAGGNSKRSSNTSAASASPFTGVAPSASSFATSSHSSTTTISALNQNKHLKVLVSPIMTRRKSLSIGILPFSQQHRKRSSH
ncbi:polycomb protein suz12-A isoform X1 [Anopheles darlingi]|uniref:polycomb protein suz12-A isoform X1 n=1 Tax=Anopheles darlingi TaxID=43151 RepID=UPI0021005164|nr:polycomb protein suz12-A isoform X1 [Anopheles darlingi]XP_049543824.1 polycomb protein suz12-A isoform X1 [Anopheles darlingi]